MLLANECISRFTGYFLTQKDAFTTLSVFPTYYTELEQQTGNKLLMVYIDPSHE